jgi:hypothetical protein
MVEEAAHLLAAGKEKRDREGAGPNVLFKGTPPTRPHFLKVSQPPTSTILGTKPLTKAVGGLF